MSKQLLPSTIVDDKLHCDLILPKHLFTSANDDNERLLTYKEVAREFNIGAQTVAVWGTNRVIPSYLIGKRSRRYKLSEIREYIQGCKVAVDYPTPELKKEVLDASK